MPITFSCPSCGSSITVRDEHAGKRGKCPRCAAGVSVPELAAPQAAPTSGRTPAARKPVAAPVVTAEEAAIPAGAEVPVTFYESFDDGEPLDYEAAAPAVRPAPAAPAAAPAVRTAAGKVSCAACGTPNPPGEKFCVSCFADVATGEAQGLGL